MDFTHLRIPGEEKKEEIKQKLIITDIESRSFVECMCASCIVVLRGVVTRIAVVARGREKGPKCKVVEPGQGKCVEGSLQPAGGGQKRRQAINKLTH